MSKIEVKFDPEIEHTEIEVALLSTSESEITEPKYWNNVFEVQETSVVGILTPLVQINKVVIDVADIVDFSLKSIDVLPQLQMTFKDRCNLTASIDTPGNDNIVALKILPQFDGIYKKIELEFYINSIRISNQFVTIVCTYKLPKFTSSTIKALGELNTFKLFEDIAKENKLGFATNVEENDEDKRFIYLDNKSYFEILNKEIKYASTEMKVYDYWVDYWNYLTFADIYERYHTIEPEEEMRLFIAHHYREADEDLKVKPQETHAVISNHILFQDSELYVNKYNIINKPGMQLYKGSDKLYSVYEFANKEYLDYLIQDEDVKRDIFAKYEYVGECYGPYNYLLSEKKRDSFMQKMKSELIEVEVNTPMLGLLRGNKINFLWYINDSHMSMNKKALEDDGIIKKDPMLTDLQISDEEQPHGEQFDNYLDRNISGQYLIIGSHIKFNNKKWTHTVTLCRPFDKKTQLLNE
jgi:hypothetical protein